MLSKFKLNQLYFKDTQFANLMTRRIFNVLLIANPYDAFMLILENITIIVKIRNQSTISHAKENQYHCLLKKKIDQSRLNIS